MSMKVERSSLDQVRQRFEMNKRKQEEKKKEYVFNERMKELQEEVIRSWCVRWWASQWDKYVLFQMLW